MRELEYGYTMELPDGWSQHAEGRYGSASTSALLTITSQMLPDGYTASQFSQFVRDDLERDWWPNASLFEVISVKVALTDHQPTTRIRYRVQESTRYCVLEVGELVVVAQVLPGNPQGFRIRSWMCENDVEIERQSVEHILERIEFMTRPARYYQQYMSVNGVSVKASDTVDPAAVESGADMVAAMLAGRPDIGRCMVRRRAELAIIPRDQKVTALPEFAYLAGTRDFTGRARDSYEIRGLGAVPGQPVSSAGEEQVLGTFGPEHPYYPYRGHVAMHEFAHGIQNLCFTQQDDEEWNRLHEQQVQAGLNPGDHMMSNVDEFFAVFSTAYFEVTDQLGRDTSRQDLEERFPEIYQALDEIYGGATIPVEYRTRLERK